jgi:hypothetical protein
MQSFIAQPCRQEMVVRLVLDRSMTFTRSLWSSRWNMDTTHRRDLITPSTFTIPFNRLQDRNLHIHDNRIVITAR